MDKKIELPKVAGKEVGQWRRQALTEQEIAEDIMRVNKDRSLISFSAAARYIGVKDNQAKLLLCDVPRIEIGKRQKIHVRDLARWIVAGRTFQGIFKLQSFPI